MADLDTPQVDRLVKSINDLKNYFPSQESFEKAINTGTMANDISELKKSMSSVNDIQKSMESAAIVGNRPQSFQEMLDSHPDYAGMSIDEYVTVVEEGLGQTKQGGKMLKSFVTGERGESGSLSAMVKENLDPLMVDVQMNESHLTLYNSLAKTPTPTRESERPRLLQRGAGAGRVVAGFAEGMRPKAGGGDRVDRLAFNLLQQGVVGATTEWGKATGSHMTENPVMFENRNRIIELLSMLNNAAFFGDRTIHKAADGTELEFDGILKIMESKLPSHIMDLQGATIDSSIYHKAAQLICDDGLIDDMTGRFDVIQHHSLSNQISINLNDKQRSVLDAVLGRSLVPGARVPGLMTNCGYLGFKNTRTLRGVDNDLPLTAEKKVDKAPQMGAYKPVIAEVDVSEAKVAAEKYSYAIAAINEHGEALPVVGKTGADATEVSVSSASGKAVKITFPDPSAIGNDIVAFNIYRLDGGSTSEDTIKKTAKWIARVPAVVGQESSYTDTNQHMPGTHYSIIKSTDRNDIDMGQLLPLLRKAYYDPDFASSDLFMLMLITCVRIWTPERVVIIKNAKGLEF